MKPFPRIETSVDQSSNPLKFNLIDIALEDTAAEEGQFHFYIECLKYGEICILTFDTKNFRILKSANVSVSIDST